MKRPYYDLLPTLVLISTILGACAVPPMPATDTPVVVTATNTPIVASPSVTTEANPTLTATPKFTLTPTFTPTPDGLPDMANKPIPTSSTFQGCPSTGDGGDTKSNMLKNRIDKGDYLVVMFDAILNQPWPKKAQEHNRDEWSAEITAEIAKYEGIPVMAEGYLAVDKDKEVFGGVQSGSESANCHATASEMNDWHIWFTKKSGEDRKHSIVIETTPRIRANHEWTLAQLRQIARTELRVRVSGWLFFDPEHAEQLGKTRGTLWEIHPIMQIEVMQNCSKWVPLDDFVPTSSPTPCPTPTP